MRRTAILLTLALICSGPCLLSVGLTRWGGGSCSPVGGFALPSPAFAQPTFRPMPAMPVSYAWHPNAKNSDQVDLYRNGVQLGAWFKGEGQYYAIAGAEWRPAAAPITPPGGLESEGPIENFGIDLDKMGVTQGLFLHTCKGSREISRKEAEDLVENGIPDDRHKNCLTFVSADQGKREAFLKRVHATPSLGDVVARALPPDYFGLFDAETKKPLFKIEGDTFYLQKADGEVLRRMGNAKLDDLDKLVAVHEGIRKPKPYDPDRDPDPRRPRLPEPKAPDVSPAGPETSGMPQWAQLLIGAAGAALLLALFGKRS